MLALHNMQKPVKLNLGLKINNFGPISKGTIDLKPLTIFIGPNNSGKSYAAMLIHSILLGNMRDHFSHIPIYGSNDPNIQKIDKEIQTIVKKNKGKETFNIPSTIIKKLTRMILDDMIAVELINNIKRNFGAEINDLVRKNQQSSTIKISGTNNFEIDIGKKVKIKQQPQVNTKYKIHIDPKITVSDLTGKEKEKDGMVVIQVPNDIADDYLKYKLTEYLIHSLQKKLKYGDLPQNSYYFPAARSGILQGHKALAASIIRHAPYVGVESSHIPKLSGVISGFMSDIIMISEEPGPFYKLAMQLELELLHGHVILQTRVKGAPPEIIYSSDVGEIPLHRTSSTISEIAPFLLYLKYIVEQNSTLIIEEPEAHLHPANQLIFAKYIVKMIRSGLNVVLTTHSVFLLEELGKYMLIEKLDPKIRENELKYGPNEFLKSEEISPYVFVRKRDGDHVIKPIETNDEYGISQEEFVKINEWLYSESMKIQEKLQMDK